MRKQVIIIAFSCLLAACANPPKTEVVNQQMDKELYPEQPTVVTPVSPPQTGSKAHVEYHSGYTIQVLALTKGTDVNSYIKKLPKGYPVFVNNKTVNGTTWRTLLLGQFNSKEEAKKIITSLPESIKREHPFVSSFKSIESSGSPHIVKMR